MAKFLELLWAAWVLGLILVIPSVALCEPTDYYVSSSEGRDKNNGLSEKGHGPRLRELTSKVTNRVIQYILNLAICLRGSWLSGIGTAEAPIHFTAYGGGELPIIDGAAMVRGAALAAILVVDHDHLEFSQLSIRNFRKESRHSVSDNDAFGILVKNTESEICVDIICMIL